jgi:hypothetical protein
VVIGSNNGAFYSPGGALFTKDVVLSSTANSTGVGAGGTLTIFGGVAISKDTYIGSNLNITGALSKGSGTFDISHPLQEKAEAGYRLIHSFIEGPRCDLIYRGTVQLINGNAIVNLDKDCVQSQDCEMTEGTFEALCTNPQYYLQNHSSFDRVKGYINGNILNIQCENQNSTDTIYWTIIAERKDPYIKQWERTNVDGYLKTEYIRIS